MTFTFLRRSGFMFGLLAALLATAVMIALGDLWRAPVVPQLLSDRMTAEIPVETFGRILGTFESWAKPLAFAAMVIGQLLVGGLIGLLAENALRRGMSPWLVLAGLIVGLWALLGLVMAPLGGLGVFAQNSNAGATNAMLAFLVVAGVYGVAVVTGVFISLERAGMQVDPGRRRLLRWATFGVPAFLAVAYLSRFMDGLASRSQPTALTANEGELPPAITPTEDFYTVSKNIVDPSVNADNWVLVVEGEVEQEIGFTYADILEMESVKQITTLECISNTVGGEYISNAEWTGVPLRTILEQAGLRDGVVDIALHAEDDYSDSIPVEKAMSDDVILAYEINGEPLPDEHGYPLRLIVPGIYGMKHVKWINRIEPVGQVHSGFWQERGWSYEAPVLTMSKIATPFYQSTVPVGEMTLIGGVAFSGDRGISRVEISLDSGQTWIEAEVEEALSDSSWVRWSYEWTPETEEFLWIHARAYEGDGTPQIEEVQDPLPDGSTGLHEIVLTAAYGEDDDLEDEEDDASA
jgi:DMSO/TMAO reductase YedYZ molybdopterin-dependent catalytic subunit